MLAFTGLSTRITEMDWSEVHETFTLMRMETRIANKIGRANRRCVSPLNAVRQCGRALYALPSLSAAVAHLRRWADVTGASYL